MASNTQIAIELLFLMSVVFACGWQAREVFCENTKAKSDVRQVTYKIYKKSK